jgi:hypothetical protein
MIGPEEFPGIYDHKNKAVFSFYPLYQYFLFHIIQAIHFSFKLMVCVTLFVRFIPLLFLCRVFSVKLTTNFHLVQSLRMCGAIPPFPQMSSWNGA